MYIHIRLMMGSSQLVVTHLGSDTEHCTGSSFSAANIELMPKYIMLNWDARRYFKILFLSPLTLLQYKAERAAAILSLRNASLIQKMGNVPALRASGQRLYK